ncbi:GGDEF domain-containing protein [Cetobacterium sp.]|uniref:GGDEF domain-containing protein n=1 Tax=Cetobacterium sp. TaxID=2071632 RepID=UPI002FC871C0
MKLYFRKLFTIFFILLFYTITFCNNDVFYLGIQDYPETELKLDNYSLNDMVRELFEKELKLNIKEVKGTWRESHKKLENGEVDFLGLVTKNNIRKTNILLSNPIFSENLYISSDKRKLESPFDLINQNIYVYKEDELPLKLLKEYLEKNKINANIIQVEDIDKYRNYFYLDSELTAVRSQNRLLVSFLGPVCIGVNKDYAYLLPQINDALNKKYGPIISNYFKKLPLYYQRKRFRNKLTIEEKEWLEKRKYITTSLEDDIALSIYIKDDDTFIGILPAYIDKLSKIMDIPIRNIPATNKDWMHVLSKFNEREIDFLTLSTTDERKTNYIFSEPIDYIPMHLLNHVNSNNYLLGVLKNGKSEEIGNDYFSEDDMNLYDSTSALFEAFKTKKVGYIITPYSIYDKRCTEEHKDIKIKDIPINFAFSEDNIILKNIFNKAISVIGDIDRNDIKDFQSIEKEGHLILIKKNEEKKRNLLYITVVVVGLLLVKIFMQRKLNIALKYDQLTHLQNRYLFNEMCKKKSFYKGTVIVMDLDNFKKANDNFGHNIGDIILAEVGAILLKTFSKTDSFRISGDEFYVFYTDNNFDEKLNKLIFLGENSKILMKYNISFSLGYYIKPETETLESAFDKADKAMYEAKKNKGFTYFKRA